MKLKLFFITVATALLAGCLPIATSMLSYDEAVAEQRHSSYTDYYFTCPAGTALPESQWLKQQQLKMEFTNYYHDQMAAQTNPPAIIPPFSEWLTNEYVKQQAERAEKSKQLTAVGHKN